MGQWPPRPPKSKFIRERADCCARFVREVKIMKYGPVALRPPKHKSTREGIDHCNEDGQNPGIWAGGRQGRLGAKFAIAASL